MVRRAGVLIVVGLFLCAAPAQARIASPQQRLAAFEKVADAYWHHVPLSCPLDAQIVPPSSLLPGKVAEARPGGCELLISSAMLPARDHHPYSTDADSACAVIVHERGHMVLGPDYFAATNPADPGHSPDPNSIMYAYPDSSAVPACQTTIRTYRVHATRRRAHKARIAYRDRAYVAGVLVAESG